MTMESALIARLFEHDALAAIIGDRAEWGVVAQGTQLPYVRLTLIDGEATDNLNAEQEFSRAVVQLDCDAATHKMATEVREHVLDALRRPMLAQNVQFQRAAVQRFNGSVEDTGIGLVHRQSIDISFYHNG